ncbi:YugN family protein [Sporosarcina aquimarina]|uniref:YugN family protein n=1 Tax=Sporosarcina aquimarina TaxID=114975 RepID=A0ABU4G1N2_9BACL|nr:YugN family protein [Sporosarcina aquimarina]MDW0110228.1 YugN family protein [Sporosarcina aquimarina]
MIRLKTGLEGRKTRFGNMRERLEESGYHLGGNWDYHTGYFDRILNREEGETLYIRAPFDVIAGRLDEDSASIKFRTPFLIKHVVNIGFDSEDSSLLTSTFNQFQEPVDKDGRIPDKKKWQEIGVREVNRLIAILE